MGNKPALPINRYTAARKLHSHVVQTHAGHQRITAVTLGCRQPLPFFFLCFFTATVFTEQVHRRFQCPVVDTEMVFFKNIFVKITHLFKGNI